MVPFEQGLGRAGTLLPAGGQVCWHPALVAAAAAEVVRMVEVAACLAVCLQLPLLACLVQGMLLEGGPAG